MKQTIYRIESNIPIARDVYEMTLLGDTDGIKAPGQFVDLRLEGFFLRRPISVCDWEKGRLTLIYKTVGAGTEYMSGLKPGMELDALTGLGNGFDVSRGGESPLLIGGGVGVPPLYALAKELIKNGARPTAVLGFNSGADVFYEDKFRDLGCRVITATADGSRGIKGFVTDGMQGLEYTFFYACGPEAMFRAVDKIAGTPGQYSFEERMGCGFGACMGCSCRTLAGTKRICKEGPVMDREEIIWQK